NVPGVAQGAIQGGQFVARVIDREVAAATAPAGGERHEAVGARPVFVYRDKGNMATIGRRAAIAQLGRLHLRGFPAWFVWLVLHLFFLIGFRNRLSVMLQWTYSYFTYKRGARIIMGLERGQRVPSAKTTLPAGEGV